MKWFRLWTDILDDHKIDQLSDYEFRIFIFLLACASEEDAVNGRLTRGLPAINRRCRRRNDHFNRAVETFQTLKLITITEDGFITINNWNKRQFPSDKVYERVKKHRKEQFIRNVSVTVNETPQIQTQIQIQKELKTNLCASTAVEHDVKQKNFESEAKEETRATTLDEGEPGHAPRQLSTILMQRFDRFWAVYPKKRARGDALKAWKSIKPSEQLLEQMRSTIGRATTSIDWTKNGGQYIPHPATWLRAQGWLDEYKQPDEVQSDNVFDQIRRSDWIKQNSPDE